MPLRYRSIYRPSQKLPFTTGGFGSTADIRRLERARRVWRRSPPRSQGGTAGVRELAEVGADSYRWAIARVPTSSASAPYQRASSTIAPSRRWPLMATGATSKPPAMSAVARIP